MQLWEFYHITSKDLIAEIAPFCFNQNAAKTAQQLVVFVTRKDLWKQRAKANLSFIDANFGANNLKAEQSNREKVARKYYSKVNLDGDSVKSGKKLQIIESKLIDNKRKLVLIRNGNSEHLLLLSHDKEMLIESKEVENVKGIKS